MIKIKKLAASILTTTMAMFAASANAAITIIIDNNSPKIAGESFNVEIKSEDEKDLSQVNLQIQDADNNDAILDEVSGSVGTISITPTKITKNAKICAVAGTRSECAANTFTIRPDSFKFGLKDEKRAVDYKNESFTNTNANADPFAGQKVYLEVTPLAKDGSEISNTCDKKSQLNLKFNNATYSNGSETFNADNSKFVFLTVNPEEYCVGNKLYFPFRFLDFGLLTLTENSFSSDFASGITNKTDKKLGIFKAAYVHFDGELKEIQSSPTALNYMGQPFNTYLTYTAHPQKENGDIETDVELKSYTYNEANKNYMFSVGLTKSFDNNGDYEIKNGNGEKEKIAGYDISKLDIEETLLGKNSHQLWEEGKITFDSLDATNSEVAKTYKLRYIRPAKPTEPQTISVFGGVVVDETTPNSKLTQAEHPQPATKGVANGITVSFGRLRFADIMHYDPAKLEVKVTPQIWQNSTWVDAGDSHTKDIIKDSKYFKIYNNSAAFTLENPTTALSDGYLKLSTSSQDKKIETYVCANLGELAENKDGSTTDKICSDGTSKATSAETPWLKGIWHKDGSKYNDNPRARVYYGLKYSPEREKAVYTRELW